MRKYKLISLVLVISSILMMLQCPSVIADDLNTLAFPTAEGYGRYADGFRCGRVVEVTNLNDSGEGSLRWALEEESGSRIVVFKVGGIIELGSPININSDVYVAGQTAPGDGITVTKYPLRCFGGENVVIRHLRVRIGDDNKTAMDGIWLWGVNNCIVDHCSTSWAIGSSIIAVSCNNTSIQKSIFAESLYNSYKRGEWGKELSSHGALLSGNTLSFVGNLVINNADENLVTKAYYSDDKFGGCVDIRNNVVYNWYDSIAYGDIEKVQIVSNYFKKGGASITDTFFSLKAENVTDVNRKAYLSGNKVIDNNKVVLDSNNDGQWNLVENTLQDYTIDEAKSDDTLFESYVNTLSADESYENIIDNVGATLPKRDYIDNRYIEELVSGKSTYVGSKSGLKGIIDSQEDVGGYPNETNFKGGEALVDTDHDGMPDEWELEHGLNPEYYYDACQIYLSDEGYTNIELYINELAGDTVNYSDNPTIQFTPATPVPEVTETPQVIETILATATPEKIENLLGDVDSDGSVNAADALSVLKHAAKIESLSDEKLVLADVNTDDRIDAVDALAILKIAAKVSY